MASILLVEDDQPVREAMARALTAHGHTVRAEATGAEALRDALAWGPDVVVLDLGLPDIDGAEMLAMLRAVSDVPVVVATAHDDEAEIVRLLDAGADDYLVKPFSGEQLDARVRAVLRRARPATDEHPVVQVGELRIDEARWEATLRGVPLELSRKEFEMLALLARRAGEVVSKRELLAKVWHQPYGGGDKTVDVHLSWLRRKLGETADEPVYLQTIRGVGIKLDVPDA
jgi:two-component system, OmpR family, KDP operon response regulator KdpE